MEIYNGRTPFKKGKNNKLPTLMCKLGTENKKINIQNRIIVFG